MMALDLLTAALLVMALFFFTAGTIGLVRLPDLHSRLHALTKADNLGLGLVVLAMLLQADSPAMVLKLILSWGLVLVGGATVCFLLASQARPRLDSSDDRRSA
jgi:multicomponent Na+:H+ antiporter subunit G